MGADDASKGPDHPWGTLEMTCKALGRATLVLDGDFRVLTATGGYDRLVCPGARKRAVGGSRSNGCWAPSSSPRASPCARSWKRAVARRGDGLFYAALAMAPPSSR